MESIENITGLILAGGAGRRVGHRDKGLIPWQGKPMIAHASDCLRAQVGEVIISCNRNFSRYGEFADRIVADTREDFQGPLAGVEAAAPYVKTQLLVIVSCDMPRLPKDFVQRLVAPLVSGTTDALEISYAHDGTRAQYLCAGMRRETLGSLKAFLDRGHRSVREWYGSRNATTVDFSDRADCFRNYNQLA